MTEHLRNPAVTVDAIIELPGGKIVLVKRKNPPHGWALPGGFVNYNESLEDAVVREAKEETCLDINLQEQFHAYGNPSRDPRQHIVTVAYIATANGKPKGADDAKEAKPFDPENLPEPMAFDHRQIIEDYLQYKETGTR